MNLAYAMGRARDIEILMYVAQTILSAFFDFINRDVKISLYNIVLRVLWKNEWWMPYFIRRQCQKQIVDVNTLKKSKHFTLTSFYC